MALSQEQKKSIEKSIGAKGHFATDVTASDTLNLDFTNARLYIGTGGDLKVGLDGGSIVTLKNIASGTYLDWLKVKKVYKKYTTARDIVAIY